VMIGVVEILNKMSYKTPIGHRMPAYCTALGKAMLAFQPLDRWDHLISMIEFVPRTKNTITDPDEFRATLLQVRERGYALQNGEFVEGLGSVAAPIFEHGGEVATAVNISGLSTLILDEKKVDGMVSGIIDCARAISAKLGYVPEISG
jgi:DNA-binding IclR family transcriptional regulator